MLPNLCCSVFELQSPNEPLSVRKVFSDVDATNRAFLHNLETSAKSEGMNLTLKVHPFPYLRACKPEELKSPTYDSDVAVCMYPDITLVGPELAHLIIERQKAFRHVFLVTQNWNVDSIKMLWHGIQTLPQTTVKRE